MNQKTILTLAGVATAALLGAYFFGKKILDTIANFNKGTAYEGAGVVGSLGNATNMLLGGAPQSLGESLSAWIAPDYDPGVYYTVTFPDNAKHAVLSTDVGPGGYFMYLGKRYVLGINQGGYKVAQAA